MKVKFRIFSTTSQRFYWNTLRTCRATRIKDGETDKATRVVNRIFRTSWSSYDSSLNTFNRSSTLSIIKFLFTPTKSDGQYCGVLVWSPKINSMSNNVNFEGPGKYLKHSTMEFSQLFLMTLVIIARRLI